MTPAHLRPEVLGQLLLMQSVMGSLPNEESIFTFVCKGLLDVPGVRSVEILPPHQAQETHDTSVFPIQVDNTPRQQLVLRLQDAAAFKPYWQYLKNFCFMLSVLLEERNQRRINQSHQRNLETRVAERTSELEREIAERYKAEEALYESEKLFRASFEHAAIGKCLVDRDGTLLKVNAAYAHILGYSPEKLIGRTVMSLTHPDDVEQGVGQMERLLNGQADSYTFEKRYLHSSGKTVWVNIGSFLLRHKDGSPQFFITHVDDITADKKAEEERLRLEEQLRQAHKMEAIGTLAGGIAHDFNNILAVIVGYTDLAIEDIPAASPAHQSLQQVQQAAQRAKELIGQILTFSKQQIKTLDPIDIASVVNESLKLLRATIPSTIAIETSIAPECGAVMADPGQINQIIMNLCSNAAHAMEEHGGTLAVSLGRRLLQAHEVEEDEEPGEYIVLEVADTGAGIASENLKRIFDPYYTTKEVGKGSGMGLAVVLGLVKGHNGLIRVTSKIGRGTSIKVFLPGISLSPVTSPESKGSLPGGSEHILVVDDEDAIVEILKRSLAKLGYTVTATTSSREALELFRAAPQRYDLLVSDQTMPEMTGTALSRKLRAIRPEFPIILCTGNDSRLSREGAGNLGVSTLLVKPVSRQKLAESLREHLDAIPAADG